MNDLPIPDQLKGRWHNAFILTYGLDATFFENALLRQFGAGCRNKIILADGTHYIDACANYARSGLIRYLNTRYFAGGIFHKRAAHAKMILLTNAKQGRLLIGSGNLNMQGYASGGELFTKYEYSTEDEEALPAFLTAREFITSLMELGYVTGTAKRYINHLLENTPWIYQQTETISPVRHNLTTGFFDQLNDVVGDEPVEELWVLSPFYDEKLKALQQMLSTWQPQQTTLLVQPASTSIEPNELNKVLTKWGDRCQVRSVTKGDDNRYIHAKMYLIKLRDRAICLQGSPNLSQVAMLFIVPQGNIELANLLTGKRHSFDYILDGLTIEPATLDLGTLNLSFAGRDDNDHENSEPVAYQITHAEWYNNLLYITYQGRLPQLDEAILTIADRQISFILVSHQAYQITLRLPAEADDLLKKPVPIQLQWDEITQTNAIFACNRNILDATINATDDDEKLGQFGQLDIEDDEIEQLLSELESTLILDQHDIWQIVGHTPPSDPDTPEDSPVALSYEDIDYHLIRQHPRIRQYIERGSGGSTQSSRSRLQLILSTVTDHFRGLLDVSEQTDLSDELMRFIEDSDAETEEEREREEEERQQRRQSGKQRIQRIFKNFIKRYLQGLKSRKFQEHAGYEIMTQNYIVFSHLLWKLFNRDWLEPKYLVDVQVDVWQFFWGRAGQGGYYITLEPKAQTDAFQIMQEYHGTAQLLAGLFFASHLAQKNYRADTKLELRNLWRYILLQNVLTFDADVIEKTWRIVADQITYEPPRPTMIVEELARLAEYETENSFLRRLEEQYGFKACNFDHKTQVSLFSHYITSLKIQIVSGEPDSQIAKSLLSEWIRYEGQLDYYRISFHSKVGDSAIRVLQFNRKENGGFFVNTVTDKDVEFAETSPIRQAQDVYLGRLMQLAEEIDLEATLPSSQYVLVDDHDRTETQPPPS